MTQIDKTAYVTAYVTIYATTYVGESVSRTGCVAMINRGDLSGSSTQSMMCQNCVSSGRASLQGPLKYQQYLHQKFPKHQSWTIQS